MPDLLIELFSEEIPARMQTRAADDLKKLVTNGLVDAGLTYGGAAAFSTPRRLTLAIEGLLAQSPTISEERKGPRVDAPEKALEGFLRSAGLSHDDLEERDSPKGKIYFATLTKPGRAAPDIVSEVLEKTIRNFPWPKSMRWGAGSLKWVRPLHSILCILTDDAGDAQTVALDVDGIASGDITRGHRFMGPEAFSVTCFDDYQARLKRSYVMLNATERADHIKQDASNQAFAAGLELVEDKGLLAEVAGLVEWPVVLMGAIDAEFLDLPAEVLQTSMREHQKFFSVKNPKTDRIERFVTVANIETADQGATILAGNQKVLAARLADAKFFWENDLRVAKAGMGEWIAQLENVTFHNKLGTQADRIARIAALAREIAPVVGADPDLAEQAARAAKADLSSEMVYEFPELQGLMGRYYAEAAGLPQDVANACEQHYSPLGPSDDVPSEPTSVAVALADKIDMLTGFWAIGEKPTGSKDPFALRRAALGVIRLVIENNITASMLLFFDKAMRRAKEAAFPDQNDSSLKEVDDRVAIMHLMDFFHDRLKVYLKDKGIRHDVIDACLELDGGDVLSLIVARATALSDVLKTDDGENLLQGFKRANNILSQAEEKDGVEYSYGADVKFAETGEEKALFAALDQAEADIKIALKAEGFATAMAAMAALRPPIDGFFEAVKINDDNEVLRRNRLNLLSRIRAICLQAADLTRVEG